jgi:hypothetical protein
MDFINETINPAIKRLAELSPDLFKIGTSIIVIAGILFIFAALLSARKSRSKTKKHSAVTTGKIIDWKIYEHSEHGTKFPIVSFTTKQGENITITSTKNAGNFTTKDEKKVIVCYDPKNPTDAAISPRIRLSQLIPPILLGCICIAIGAYGWTFIKGW